MLEMQIFVKHQIYKTMKKLQNNFTTPEQSKRLLKIGVHADSADCYWQLRSDTLAEYLEYRCYIGTIPAIIDNLYSFRNGYTIPCWSVGRLIEIYHICVSPGCSFTFHVCFPNLMNEIIYKLAEADSNGWLNLSRLEE